MDTLAAEYNHKYAVLDFYTLTNVALGGGETIGSAWYYDGVHPNDTGHSLQHHDILYDKAQGYAGVQP